MSSLPEEWNAGPDALGIWGWKTRMKDNRHADERTTLDDMLRRSIRRNARAAHTMTDASLLRRIDLSQQDVNSLIRYIKHLFNMDVGALHVAIMAYEHRSGWATLRDVAGAGSTCSVMQAINTAKMISATHKESELIRSTRMDTCNFVREIEKQATQSKTGLLSIIT